MVKVIIPTLNAEPDWPRMASALLQCVEPGQVLVIDSESTDRTNQLARDAGFTVVSIARQQFNHGGTRQQAAAMFPAAEILVYLTQDAILAGPNAIHDLIAAFADPKVGAAYGRQLPRLGANAIERHAREFNYPPVSQVRDFASREQFGFKTIFISNSFAAYRQCALTKVGGFPSNVIFGEDTITAARLLIAGYKVAYVAEASVYHSHAYNWRQELERYFDIGVLHQREKWLLQEFGKASGEGKRFVLSELRYLLRQNVGQIPSAVIRTGMKFLGYRLGRNEDRLAPKLKRLLSMNPGFWDKAPSNSTEP